MARGKPKREKIAIPASYIRPRELPNGRKSYNVRAYNPATRTCKTLGTFKTRREAEFAFKKGAEALSRAKPDVAPTASAEPDDPRAPPSVSKKRAREGPRATRASNRERQQSASAKSAELASPPKKRRKKNEKNASPPRVGVEPETRTGAPAEVTSPPTRRVSAVFRTLASAAAAVSPFANPENQETRQSPTDASPGGESDSSRRGVLAKTFSTPAATPPSAPRGGGDMWSRVCAFIRGGEYPVPVPGLMDDEPGDPGDPGDGDVPRDEDVPVPGRDARDSPGPAERLAAFLESAVRRLRGGGGGAAGLEPRPAGVAVKSRGLTVTVDVRRA